MINNILIFFVCVFLAGPALASEAYPSPQYIKCAGEDNGIDCLIAEGDRIEAHFNTVHQRFMSSKLATDSFKHSDKDYDIYLESCYDYMEKLYEGGAPHSVSAMEVNMYEVSRRAIFLESLASLKSKQDNTMEPFMEELEKVRLDRHAAHNKLNEHLNSTIKNEEQKKELLELLQDSENKWEQYLKSTEAYLKEQKGEEIAVLWLIEAYENRLKIYEYMHG